MVSGACAPSKTAQTLVQNQTRKRTKNLGKQHAACKTLTFEDVFQLLMDSARIVPTGRLLKKIDENALFPYAMQI